MDLLDRLHDRLRNALRDGGPGTAAPTVGDIYQRLIPYRAVRGELGIMELADYEHALLRLLAGERGYAEIGEERARAELVAELSSPHPILGVYRDYSAAPVRLTGPAGGAPGAPLEDSDASPYSDTVELPALPGSVGADARGASEGRADPSPRLASRDAPGAPSNYREADPPGAADGVGEHTPPFAGPDQRTARPAQASVVSAPQAAPASPPSSGEAEQPKRCVHCGAGLPGVPDVRFCPDCGGDQRDTDCAGCGSSLRAEWRFCIRCGTPRPGVAPRT